MQIPFSFSSEIDQRILNKIHSFPDDSEELLKRAAPRNHFLQSDSEVKKSHPESPTMTKFTKEKIRGCLKGSALTLATLIGVIGGVIFGLCLRQRERE